MTGVTLIAFAFMAFIVMMGIGVLLSIALFAIRMCGYELHISIEPKLDESLYDDFDDDEYDLSGFPRDYNFLDN